MRPVARRRREPARSRRSGESASGAASVAPRCAMARVWRSAGQEARTCRRWLNRPLDVGESASGAETCRAGSLPRGRRSFSMRALSSRMSRTSARSPPVGHGLKQGAGALVEVTRSDRPGAQQPGAPTSRASAALVLLMRAMVRLIGPFFPSGAQIEVDNDAELAGRQNRNFLTRLTIAVALAAASASEAPPTGSYRQ